MDVAAAVDDIERSAARREVAFNKALRGAATVAADLQRSRDALAAQLQGARAEIVALRAAAAAANSAQAPTAQPGGVQRELDAARHMNTRQADAAAQRGLAVTALTAEALCGAHGTVAAALLGERMALLSGAVPCAAVVLQPTLPAESPAAAIAESLTALKAVFGTDATRDDALAYGDAIGDLSGARPGDPWADTVAPVVAVCAAAVRHAARVRHTEAAFADEVRPVAVLMAALEGVRECSLLRPFEDVGPVVDETGTSSDDDDVVAAPTPTPAAAANSVWHDDDVPSPKRAASRVRIRIDDRTVIHTHDDATP
jgi:hypothetical protein